MAARTRTRLAQWLRGADLADILVRHTAGDLELEGSLYASQAVELSAEQEAEVTATAARYRMDRERFRQATIARVLYTTGRLRLVTGEPLSSESVAPFQLDGLGYRSVACFYHSLKLPEGDPRRAAVARGERQRRRSGGRTTFGYHGQEITVGSLDHGLLIARATEAKVLAHDHVRRALAATGASRLYMGDAGSQVLGRTMPLVLMLLRFRLAA